MLNSLSPNDVQLAILGDARRFDEVGRGLVHVSLRKLREESKLDGIRSIVLLGPPDPSLSEENSYINELKRHFRVEEYDVPRITALSKISDLKEDRDFLMMALHKAGLPE